MYGWKHYGWIWIWDKISMGSKSKRDVTAGPVIIRAEELWEQSM